MTSADIQALLHAELQALPSLQQINGLDLEHCLVPPVLQTYLAADGASPSYSLWTVLEEHPSGGGYTVYYDEETQLFGLGLKTETGERMDCGSHGSFLQAVSAI